MKSDVPIGKNMGEGEMVMLPPMPHGLKSEDSQMEDDDNGVGAVGGISLAHPSSIGYNIPTGIGGERGYGGEGV